MWFYYENEESWSWLNIGSIVLYVIWFSQLLFPLLELQCAVQFLTFLLQKISIQPWHKIFWLEVSIKLRVHADLCCVLADERLLVLTYCLDNTLDQHSHIYALTSELPSTRGEELQTKCLLELYGLKVQPMLL